MQVGNELGAGKPYKAKLAAMVALGCAFVMGFINVAWTVACALSLLYVVVVRTDWEAEALKAEKLTRGVEMGNWNGSKNKDKMIHDEENKGLLVYGNGNKIDI
uniref:Uncharacterized protein LOC101500282 n=1 Tax=Cicer arietinum TaxID=3827 RepID=A0A1S2XK17_CICAR|nr:uncharacterized protein LOC101500282 [Cicer arietinum]